MSGSSDETALMPLACDAQRHMVTLNVGRKCQTQDFPWRQGKQIQAVVNDKAGI
jgi:hypothetical protein